MNVLRPINEFGWPLSNGSFYVWRPQPDITVYELSMAIPGFSSFSYVEPLNIREDCFIQWYEGLPDNVKRHIVEIKER